MNEKVPTPSENDLTLGRMKDFQTRILSAGRDTCRKYLIGIGINNPDGTLTKEYGGEYTTLSPEEQERLLDDASLRLYPEKLLD